VPGSAVERAVRIARRRIAWQLLLDRVAVAWAVALAIGLVWLLIDPGRWVIPAALLVVATLVAVVRTVRDYPTSTAAALELDDRFDLKERVTASVGLPSEQRETPVGQAVAADAEKYATGLRVAGMFPLHLRRSAAVAAMLAALVVVVAGVWHPITDSGLFTPDDSKLETAKKPGEPAAQPKQPKPEPDIKQPDQSAAQRLAALRAELDQLERQQRENPADKPRLSDLTAAEDAARALERDSLDRLARMEAQLKQLEPLLQSPEFKEGPGKDAASGLAEGDLAAAEKALGEMAKAAKEKPNDPQLREQIEKLKDELRKAADNQTAREKLKELIEQAKRDGRDTSGLQQELDKLGAESKQSQQLRDLADKLDAAGKELKKGNGDGAAKQLSDAADAVRGIQDEVKGAKDAQDQLRRAEQLRAEAGEPNGKSGENPGGDGGGNGLADPRPAGKEPKTAPRAVRPRIPLSDPKAPLTAAGSGEFGSAFTKTDPDKLGPAIERAMRAAPAATAGQPLSPADRDAIREFFERLGK
jgi:hypothetical protein